MLIVFFSNLKNEAPKRLLEDIQNRFPDHPIETVQSVKALWEWFHDPVMERTILILAPDSRRQLEALVSLGELMNDNPILLILPDREPLTVSAGHKFYPRFVCYSDSDFSCLSAVLARMIENMESKKGLGIKDLRAS
jgi:hypothetical protein